jgi:hypothetical protein
VHGAPGGGLVGKQAIHGGAASAHGGIRGALVVEGGFYGGEFGTSIKTQPHVSHLANKQIKALLTQAAICAIRHDPNIRDYYQRKIAEGKNKWLVINNVRNKLIHRIFALVKNKQSYQIEYIRLIRNVA